MKIPTFRTGTRLAVLCLFWLGSGTTSAQRDAPVPNPDAEEERRTFVVAVGFEVNRFAADPFLVKPVAMVVGTRIRRLEV